jgi:hypothetical protein
MDRYYQANKLKFSKPNKIYVYIESLSNQNIQYLANLKDPIKQDVGLSPNNGWFGFKKTVTDSSDILFRYNSQNEYGNSPIEIKFRDNETVYYVDIAYVDRNNNFNTITTFEGFSEAFMIKKPQKLNPTARLEYLSNVDKDYYKIEAQRDDNTSVLLPKMLEILNMWETNFPTLNCNISLKSQTSKITKPLTENIISKPKVITGASKVVEPVMLNPIIEPKIESGNSSVISDNMEIIPKPYTDMRSHPSESPEELKSIVYKHFNKTESKPKSKSAKKQKIVRSQIDERMEMEKEEELSRETLNIGIQTRPTSPSHHKNRVKVPCDGDDCDCDDAKWCKTVRYDEDGIRILTFCSKACARHRNSKLYLTE